MPTVSRNVALFQLHCKQKEIQFKSKFTEIPRQRINQFSTKFELQFQEKAPLKRHAFNTGSVLKTNYNLA